MSLFLADFDVFSGTFDIIPGFKDHYPNFTPILLSKPLIKQDSHSRFRVTFPHLKRGDNS